MNHTEIEVALAAANPLPDGAAAALPLRGAEVELTEQLTAIAVSRHPRPVHAGRRGRRRLAVVLAVAAAVVSVLALLPSGERDGGPAPAFAASLVRFANHSPLALLDLPEWHVVYADEQPGGTGEMHFVRGPADANGNPEGTSFRDTASLAGRVASLTWGPVNPAALTYLTGGHQHAATGLGVTARRFISEARGRGWLDISALIIDRGRALQFRATVTDMAMFYAELRALRAVDTMTWLEAMPPNVIQAADSRQTIRLMLKGIPLPPGFDAARVRGARLLHDRYQLGAAVTGTVACMWIADWSHARATGDTATVNRAIAAMASAPHWPILHEMARQGAWPQVLIGYAKAMPTGRVTEGSPGIPLTAAVNAGLGCGEWGVRLPNTRHRQPLGTGR